MPYFPVDDTFWGNPKALKCSLRTIGLWAMAGSYCGQALTDGFVPLSVLRLLRGTKREAGELVTAGLWHEVRAGEVRRGTCRACPSILPGAGDGWLFHDWLVHNFTAEEVKERRAEVRRERQAAGRKGGLASGQVRRGERPKKDKPDDFHIPVRRMTKGKQ